MLSRSRERAIRRLRVARSREREGAFLVEGVRAAREFLHPAIPFEIRFAVVSPRLEQVKGGLQVLRTLEAASVPTDEVEDAALDALAATEHPQGVLLVVEETPRGKEDLERLRPSRLLLLDGVQDPGNAGTLVRTAHAFGVDAVLATEGTVDLFNAKVVRSSAGALAHLPVLRFPRPEAVEWVRRLGGSLLAGEREGLDVYGFEPGPAWCLAVGNEGAGLSEEIRAAADVSLSVPIREGVDSLNAAVAGAILLFALTRAGERGRAQGGGSEGSGAEPGRGAGGP